MVKLQIQVFHMTFHLSIEPTTFFYQGFLLQTFTIHRATGGGGGYLFNSSLQPPSASKTLTQMFTGWILSWMITAESSPLYIASELEFETFGTRVQIANYSFTRHY